MLDFLVHLRDHTLLALVALGAALVLGVPLGAFAARHARGRGAVLGFVGIGRVVPSLAVLALMLPLVGVGFAPAAIALTLLAIPPIAINTDLGLRAVPSTLRDAARGLGMDARQIGRRVDWPLALPVVFSGVRTAAVEVVASATLAAFIGGGGLGEYIVNGIALNDSHLLLEGAAAVGALALAVQGALGTLERRLTARAAGA
ncbi:MAG: hypothetical protein NVS1B2_12940 [Vulcanimicrobiaceae bacterium]